MPMGEEKYYIYTDASNMDLTAGNLDSFEGKNIGVSKDNIAVSYTHLDVYKRQRYFWEKHLAAAVFCITRCLMTRSGSIKRRKNC